MIPDSYVNSLTKRKETGRAYLLVHVQFPEDFRGIQEMLVLKDPGACQLLCAQAFCWWSKLTSLH
jgi:hypothetical protein